MRLKRLELFGFKSFADRTVFDFGADTLTGIVGPNGCGKSNVVDAMRWVLGEQRPTSMRGAEMTDVIFKGSSSRPGLAVAEVTIVLDNESGTLEGRGPEVSITRRVFKSGEGEYSIDGERVRLKDVREMLFDTGLGSRGYSVLEQGRIDAVLSANPIERRRIFEEAAGISRYRQRKHEAELRLKRVDQDLARLDDVLGELGSRVRSLKIQAGKAERWAAARDAWTRERTRLLRHRAWGHAKRIEELAAELAGLETRAAELKRARAACEGDVERREAEGRALAAELERLAQALSSAEGDARALDERRSQLSESSVTLSAAAREEGERARVLAARRAERRAELDAHTAEVRSLGSEVERLAAARDAGAERHRELEQRQRADRKRAEEQNELVLGLLHEKTEAQNTVRHLSEARGPADERGERLAERLEEARGHVAELAAEESRARAAAERAADVLTGTSDARRELVAEVELCERQLAERERARSELELERARVQSRIEFLRDRERDLEELDQTARDVLAALDRRGAAPRSEGADAADAPPLDADALSGLVADRLSTETRFARALDAVLGERARALVARDADAALRLARWLSATGRGPLGLVLEAGLAPRAADAVADEAHVNADDARVIGRLAEHVRAAPGAEDLARRLVGGALLVRDLDAAVELVRERAGLVCVTPEGELVDASLLVGGQRSLTHGAVGRRSSAAELEAGLAAEARALAELEGEIVELSERRAARSAALAEKVSELELARHALAREQAALATAAARRQDREAGLASIESERTRAGAEVLRLAQDLAEAEARRERAERRFAEENARLAELEVARHSLEEERTEAARARARAELEHGRAHEKLQGLEHRLDLVRAGLAETEAELERAERLAREHAERAREHAAEAERMGGEASALAARRGELKEALAAARGVAEASREAVLGVRRRSDDVTRELEGTAAATTDTRLAVQRAELALVEVRERAREELELDLAAEGAEPFEPEPELAEEAALAALESDVRGLRSELDRLGPVNMEALGELEEVGARLDFLTAQRKDLAQAQAALRETVRTIDDESKRLFLEAFEEVRGNFQRIFRQLFGGGRADVLLEEGADVLEAGVEIVARPPGRELLSIGLLSGGQRTLTALALLFAVFEARPSPFCVLDEVDAALDDANIDRFIAMVDGYRANTQFVVVTHNKGTMAACQTLYGVTMETKGVSRRVQVELGEVDDWTARDAGSNGAGGAVARNGSDVASGAGNGRSAAGRSPARDPGEAALDPESGEPVVELVPARALESGAVSGGTAHRVGSAGVGTDGEPAPAEPADPGAAR